MNKHVLKQIKSLRPGDMIIIHWFDAWQREGEFLKHPSQADYLVKTPGVFKEVSGSEMPCVVIVTERPPTRYGLVGIPVPIIKEIELGGHGFTHMLRAYEREASSFMKGHCLRQFRGEAEG